MTSPRQVHAIGGVALAALEAADWTLSPIPDAPDAPYRLAGREVVWLGANPRVMHPRMVVVTDAPRASAPARLAPFTGIAWRAPVHVIGDHSTFAARVAALREASRQGALDAPRGFGVLFAGATPAFPLDLALPRVHRLAAALAGADRAALESAAAALLGVGPGLTPSGDDFVGALCFARTLLASDASERAARSALAERLIAIVPARSHRIAAALFGDLARGASYGWLHDLVDALADPADASLDRAIVAARALASVGHSSGWDMLAGFTLGVTGSLQ